MESKKESPEQPGFLWRGGPNMDGSIEHCRANTGQAGLPDPHRLLKAGSGRPPVPIRPTRPVSLDEWLPNRGSRSDFSSLKLTEAERDVDRMSNSMYLHLPGYELCTHNNS